MRLLLRLAVDAFLFFFFFFAELEALFNEEVGGKQPNRMVLFFPRDTTDAQAIARWEIIGLLSPSKRPFREMLSKNSISEFEFREYLFARQLHLLLGLDRISTRCLLASHWWCL